MIIKNVYDWISYASDDVWNTLQHVPFTPPSYPCHVSSAFSTIGEYTFVCHSFLTVEEIEKPGEDDYGHMMPEAEELMLVAVEMYSRIRYE